MGKRKDSVEGVSLRDILNEAGMFLDLRSLERDIASDGHGISYCMDHTANSLVSYKYDIGSERNHEGLSEQRYLQFGVVWREFGARDKTASCRKMDQFIFFEDIHEFVTQICRIWGVPVPDYGNNFIFVTYIKGSSSSWGTSTEKNLP